MINLIVLSCVGSLNSVCTFTMVDYSYPSMERCRMAAALTAGRNRIRIVPTRPRDDMVYWYKCTLDSAASETGGWTKVEGAVRTANAEPPF
ncbi:MAG: hypothetical protein K9H25_21390 [Rhodospirillum sp.]|nr:hypothetical protein [Rhodospirillum sp.]MCF8491656.1 hypothetical protein [Rhodospirillum sp.]MCF8501362.1 hypothetical protein [Rhodospirillum sp.]